MKFRLKGDIARRLEDREINEIIKLWKYAAETTKLSAG